jgi:hypothetical protein
MREVEYFSALLANRRPTLSVKHSINGSGDVGMFAQERVEEGSVVFTDSPLSAMQEDAEEEQLLVCRSCNRFLGNLQSQFTRCGGDCKSSLVNAGAKGKGKGKSKMAISPLPTIAEQAYELTPNILREEASGWTYCSEACRSLPSQVLLRQTQKQSRWAKFEKHALLEEHDETFGPLLLLAGQLVSFAVSRAATMPLDEAQLPVKQLVQRPYWEMVSAAQKQHPDCTDALTDGPSSVRQAMPQQLSSSGGGSSRNNVSITKCEDEEAISSIRDIIAASLVLLQAVFAEDIAKYPGLVHITRTEGREATLSEMDMSGRGKWGRN